MNCDSKIINPGMIKIPINKKTKIINNLFDKIYHMEYEQN